MNRKQALQKKFLAFLAVARGSIQEPYVIHLKYVPKKKPKKKIVLIGKGITFDSGGLSLKPANSMENMKIDMAGAATVLGLFSILPAIRPDVEVHGVILACENMPSGDAYRPGDIIESMSGKTIEVLNTDAEGRITLADALTYASGMKPDAIVDLATLTGACVVALGDTHAGLFGNSETLNQRIMRAAEESGEGMVEFPLPEEYRQTVQSRVADMRNTSFMRMGGAITAALFLQEFVGKSPVTKKAIDWAHIDIAGPVYAEMPLIPYWQFGATGYGVRMLAKLVEEFGE
jgi:leucyl aminopeptidase